MEQLAVLAVWSTIVGGLLGWKGPGPTRELGWKVATVAFVVLVILLLLDPVVIWASQHLIVVVILLVVVGLGATLFLLRSSIRLNGPARRATPGRQTPKSGDSVTPGFDPFVGKTSNGRLVTVSAEDTIGVIGPPRSGKTAGILIPQALMWGGPMVSVSVRDDVLRTVGDQRERIGQPYGGHVYIFDPAESSRYELAKLAGGDQSRIPLIRWSPVDGCEKAETAKLRAEAMVWACIPTDGGATRHPHFERLASTIIRTFFHAAALHGRTLEEVLMWIDAKNIIEPADLIRNSNSTERLVWANEVLGLGQLAQEERGSAFSTAGNALDAFKLSTVLRNCSETDVDLRSFINQRSSLFVIAGVGMQRALAPLFSAMLESIAFTIIDDLGRETGGKLEPRLLLQLDEIANIAPLPNLLTLLTVCGGSGVCLSYASQNWQQIASRYGQDQMKSIWQSTKAQVVFGGVGDRDMLEDLSQLMGVKKEKIRSHTRERFKLSAGSVTTSEQDAPKLRSDEIFNAGRSAHLFHGNTYERIDPALYFDPNLGKPFHSAVGWTPSTTQVRQLAEAARPK